MLERPEDGRREEGVVDDERGAGIVGERRERGDVREPHVRIRERLDEDGLRLGPQRRAHGLQIRDVDAADLDPLARTDIVEEEPCDDEDVLRGDAVVALAEQAEDRVRDGGHAGGARHSRLGAFECRNLLLQRVRGRVGGARVEERLRLPGHGSVDGSFLLGAGLEGEGGSLVDRRGVRARGGIGLLARVDRTRREALLVSLRAHGGILAGVEQRAGRLSRRDPGTRSGSRGRAPCHHVPRRHRPPGRRCASRSRGRGPCRGTRARGRRDRSARTAGRAPPR